MNREAGINVVEKERLRDAIDDQVRRFLEAGGKITVLEGGGEAPIKAVHGGGWNPASDLTPAFD
jgi:hypothetical protein